MEPTGMADLYYGVEYHDIIVDFGHFCEQRPELSKNSLDRFLLIEAWIQQLAQEGRNLQPAHLEVARLSPHRLLDTFKSHKRREEIKRKGGDEAVLQAALEAFLGQNTLENLHESCDFFPPLANAITPREISDFLVRVASLFGPKTLLDPVCGCGTLLHAVRESLHPESVIGLSGNPRFTRIARMLLGDQGITLLDASTDSSIETGRFDLIVADPPQTKWRLAQHGEFPSLRKYPRWKPLHSFVVWASEHLSAEGVALIFVDSSFFWDKRAKVIHRRIAANGSPCIRAAFHVPRNDWWKKQPLRESYLLMLQPGEQDKEIFVAQYSQDPDHQSQVVNNLKLRRSTEDPTKGRLCQLDSYRSFHHLVAKDHIKRLARRAGYSSVPSGDIFLEWPEPDQSDQVLEKEMCFFHHKKSSFSLRPWDETDWDENYWTLRLDLNAGLVIPEFLVYWFNTTQLGKETLRAARRCDVSSEWMIDLEKLWGDTKLYLPPLEEQRSILNTLNKLKSIRADLEQLETSLIDAELTTIESVALKVGRISRIDHDLELEWYDSLPFPMASVLWHHRASGPNYRKKYKTLLNFFEATAEFLAVLHLSALSRDEVLWSKYRSNLALKLSGKEAPLTRTCFGNWRIVIEYFANVIRKGMKDRTWKDRLQQLYAVNGEAILSVLCHNKLLRILQEANRIRNDEDGHTGAISDERAQSINDELEALVSDLRAVFGLRWMNHELVQAGGGRRKDGNYKSTVRKIKGTRAPFVEEEIDVNEFLEEDQLYFYDAITHDVLPLLPLIKVTLSSGQPADTCYFFSRLDGSNRARFLSYHSDKEPKYTEEKSDIPQILGRLFPPVSLSEGPD